MSIEWSLDDLYQLLDCSESELPLSSIANSFGFKKTKTKFKIYIFEIKNSLPCSSLLLT